MPKKLFETVKSPIIKIGAIVGDLQIRASNEPQVVARGECELVEIEGGLSISGASDLRLIVPQGSMLTIGNIQGDAVLKGVYGDVTIGEILGDVVLSDLGMVSIGNVHGDVAARGLSGELQLAEVHGDVAAKRVAALTGATIHGDLAARRIDGPLAIGEAHGDVSVNHTTGDISINLVGRDVNLSDTTGTISLPQVQGDVRLAGPTGPGKHAITAEGDIVVLWPPDQPLEVAAAAPKIVDRLSLGDGAAAGDTLSGRIGDGGPLLNLSAAGRIVLKASSTPAGQWAAFNDEPESKYGSEFNTAGWGSDELSPEALAGRIRQQVEESLRTVTQDLNGLLGPEFGRRIAEQVSQKAERAAMKAGRAQRKMDRRAFAGGFAAASQPQAASTAVDTSAEQLKILKMVENGTITPDEANMLLAALGG